MMKLLICCMNRGLMILSGEMILVLPMKQQSQIILKNQYLLSTILLTLKPFTWNPTRKDQKLFYVLDRKSTRLNSSHVAISYAVFCLKKKKKNWYRGWHDNRSKTIIY